MCPLEFGVWGGLSCTWDAILLLSHFNTQFVNETPLELLRKLSEEFFLFSYQFVW